MKVNSNQIPKIEIEPTLKHNCIFLGEQPVDDHYPEHSYRLEAVGGEGGRGDPGQPVGGVRERQDLDGGECIEGGSSHS